MKISTGLRPEVKVIPITEQPYVSRERSQFPRLTMSKGWQIEFRMPDDRKEAPRDTIISIVFSYFEPKVQKMGAEVVIHEEFPDRAERLAYARRQHDIPDDCFPEAQHDHHSAIWIYRYTWWEVEA